MWAKSALTLDSDPLFQLNITGNLCGFLHLKGKSIYLMIDRLLLFRLNTIENSVGIS